MISAHSHPNSAAGSIPAEQAKLLGSSPVRLQEVQKQTLWLAIYIAICAALYFKPVGRLFTLAISSDVYSHILVVPLLSVVLIYQSRRKLFRETRRKSSSCYALLIAGIVLGLAGWRIALTIHGEVALALAMLGFLFLIWAGFLWFYGIQAFQGAQFPLLFLLLMIPLPTFVIERLIAWLQSGSATVTEWVFQATRTPAVRDGMFFTLPGVTIEIAKECSGIRSTLALVITCLLAGYLLLRSPWARAILLFASIPVVILKNGIRIATLTLLSIHVDPDFLYGRLHREGGGLFFILGLAMLLPLLWKLQKIENRRGTLSALTAPEAASPPSTR